jgi:hypothetical protein
MTSRSCFTLYFTELVIHDLTRQKLIFDDIRQLVSGLGTIVYKYDLKEENTTWFRKEGVNGNLGIERALVVHSVAVKRASPMSYKSDLKSCGTIGMLRRLPQNQI